MLVLVWYRTCHLGCVLISWSFHQYCVGSQYYYIGIIKQGINLKIKTASAQIVCHCVKVCMGAAVWIQTTILTAIDLPRA